MRIVEVITGGEPGGAQRHVFELVQYLAIQGHQVAVVHGGGHWLSQAIKNIASVYYLRHLQRDISWHDMMAFTALLGIVRNLRPDVIHAHSSKAGILSRLVGTILQVPVVYTSHGLVFFDTTRSRRSRKFYQLLETWAAKRSRGIITLSNMDYEFMRSVKTRAIVEKIPNGVPVRALSAKQLGCQRRIGFIGRFSREKGLDVVLKAAEQTMPWQWIIAGDGPFRSQITHAAERLPNLKWMGWIENIDEFFSEIDVLVQPSYKEGLPYTVLDAMAAGIPVVATPVGALNEILRAIDIHLLCPVGNVQALVESILYAFEHYNQIAESSYRLVKDHYNLNNQLEQTARLLTAVVES
ncbi:glycosyltransferase [Sulfobacillus thermosulfidooxidans]|uniref:glycosyltransferase n=1 Tax=Sulfobacillus thermosulfidooxidans TaxID=28034 RepID=UPI0006B515B4|nr:glycosyltransferase [Sulfobacillus thermosulfidooxidans]